MKQEPREGDAGCCLVVGLRVRSLSVFASDSEMRVQSAEQRALKAEEALLSASVKIQDLERKLQGRSSLSSEGTEFQLQT